MTAEPERRTTIEVFLEQYRQRELLRFLTCGSVDDGKSTLIGRLLHDSHGVYEDQLNAARRDSVKHGTTGDEIDLALLVDGLQAEREQGITIDVAYRYFATPRRKFIIADTPGHEQYTRNMATGASTCDLAVILVDATRGVLDQTRRHAFIATLLGIRHLVVAINKMDLVEFDERRFEELRQEFAGFAAKLQVADVHFIPMSALDGDNVVHGSDRMPWYRGGPLLDYLETLHIASDRNLIDLRLPLQLVVRPDAEFRGYAGAIASGVIRRGDPITVLPSGRKTHVKAILGIDGEREQAFAPMPVTVTLADEVDASRGDMLVHPNNAPRLERELEAMIVWMHDEAATIGREYLLKQTTLLVPAVITDVRYRMNVNTLHRETCSELRLNEIGRLRVETPRLVAFDPYVRNRATGSFILIDRLTNATVGAGMILDLEPASAVLSREEGETADSTRQRRLTGAAFQVRLGGPGADEKAHAVRDALASYAIRAEIVDQALVAGLVGEAVAEDVIGRMAAYLHSLGVIVIVPRPGAPAAASVVEQEGTVLDLGDVSVDDVLERLRASRLLA